MMEHYFNAEDLAVQYPDMLEFKDIGKPCEIMGKTTKIRGGRFEMELLCLSELINSYPMAIKRLKYSESDLVFKDSVYRQVKKFHEKGYERWAAKKELIDIDPRKS